MAETVTNATLTLDDIRRKVYYLAKESTSSSLFPCSEVTNIINSALAKVFNAVAYQYETIYRNTCANVEGYVIPDVRLLNGNAMVDEVWLDDVLLTPVTYTEWGDISGDDTAAEPTDFWVSGNVIFLRPIPDACYQMKIRYRPEFKKLVACSDIPNLSDNMIDAAVYYAVHVMKAKDEEYNASDYFKRMYDEAIAEVMMIPPGVYKAEATGYGGAA